MLLLVLAYNHQQRLLWLNLKVLFFVLLQILNHQSLEHFQLMRLLYNLLYYKDHPSQSPQQIFHELMMNKQQYLFLQLLNHQNLLHFLLMK